MLIPSNKDKKSGDSVAEALQSKHPDARVADPTQLPSYSETPDFVDLDITDEIVEKVARQLSGSAGASGTDPHALTHWLLHCGTASGRLRTALTNFVESMGNKFPPWAAYRALMAGRLLALDVVQESDLLG
jgi:hypothetical protein